MGEEDIQLIPQKAPLPVLDKNDAALFSELPGASPIVQTMVEIGQIVAKRGIPPQNIQAVTEARRETSLVKLLNTPWDGEGKQVYGQIELGVVKDGDVTEGFKMEWTISAPGRPEHKHVDRSSPSITAELRRKASADEVRELKLHHIDMSVTLSKSGTIMLRMDAHAYPDIMEISGMAKVDTDIYQYYGQVNNLPEGVEQIVTPALTSIRDRLNLQLAATASTGS